MWTTDVSAYFTCAPHMRRVTVARGTDLRDLDAGDDWREAWDECDDEDHPLCNRADEVDSRAHRLWVGAVDAQ